MFFRRPRIAFNMRPRRGPFGGGNQWLLQTSASFARAGYRAEFRLTCETDLVLGTFAGLSGELGFSYEKVGEAKALHPRLICIQRINDNDARKGTGGMDAHLEACNAVADHTVFVSRWLRDYHIQRWFDASRPHSVIVNGADPAVFHPFGAQIWRVGEPLRLCTHHWSDNPSKGFDLYAALDEQIASGRLCGVELWVIGRWPSSIRWRSARTFGPASGSRLATLLRQCHVCVTGSRHEPGAMHPVEALACGLPLLYTADTGGTVELGEKFGIEIQGGDFVQAVERLKANYLALRRDILAEAPSGDQMCLAYRRLVQAVLAVRT
jgi:glycosyltransferase involved in cell wall biosynthesis